jgi:pimeloyl-ACP methyl ester carboxylesterase
MRRRDKAALGVAGAAALVYLGMCVGLYARQRKLLYKPPAMAAGDEAYTMPLRGTGPRVLVSVREAEGPAALVYYGGNAEDVSANLPAFEQAFPTHALYLLHYRGYGGSEGEPNEADLYQDALALYDHARRRHSQVIVVGRSLGSGIAVRVASARRVSRLVLVTPYDSMVGIGQSQYPYMPISLLLKDRYESYRYAPRVRAPTRIIVADADEVIPRASTEQLFHRFAPGIARLDVLPGTHSSVTSDPRYLPLFTAP